MTGAGVTCAAAAGWLGDGVGRGWAGCSEVRRGRRGVGAGRIGRREGTAFVARAARRGMRLGQRRPCGGADWCMGLCRGFHGAAGDAVGAAAPAAATRTGAWGCVGVVCGATGVAAGALWRLGPCSGPRRGCSAGVGRQAGGLLGPAAAEVRRGRFSGCKALLRAECVLRSGVAQWSAGGRRASGSALEGADWRGSVAPAQRSIALGLQGLLRGFCSAMPRGGGRWPQCGWRCARVAGEACLGGAQGKNLLPRMNADERG
jgi:hypothetical protein